MAEWKNYSRDFRAVADAAIARSCINFHVPPSSLSLSPSLALCVSLHLFIHSLIYIKCKLIPFVWPELSAAAANEMPSINEPKATQHIRQTESHTHTHTDTKPHIRLLRNCVSLPFTKIGKAISKWCSLASRICICKHSMEHGTVQVWALGDSYLKLLIWIPK